MNSELHDHSVVVANRAQLSTDLQHEKVVMDVKAGAYFGLSGVGVRIWELIQQPNTVGEITHTLTEEYDVDQGRCRSDVVDFLRKMISQGLAGIQHETVE